MSTTSRRRDLLAKPRELGAVYTPAEIVRFMLRSCLESVRPASEQPLRLLDPACGDGAFLVGVTEQLGRDHTTDAVALYGVDVDPDAIDAARQRLQPMSRPTVSIFLRHGDSLTGAGFDELSNSTADGTARRSRNQSRRHAPRDEAPPSWVERSRKRLMPDESARHHAERNGDSGRMTSSGIRGSARQTKTLNHCTALDWPRTFPDVAAAGGFDVVIGNPPYLREKDAKAVFDRIAATPLGRRWRQPRMDLWHYFLHRGLDLLRPGGVLSFIVNSYWTSSESARPLIERLQTETTIQRLVLLGTAPVFGGVSGRHMILQLRKGLREEPCRLLDLSETPNPIAALDEMTATVGSHEMPTTEEIRTQASLYDRRRFLMRPRRGIGQRRSGGKHLGDAYVVRQGIAENPPFVTRRMSNESGGRLTAAAGVFVLTDEEIARLRFATNEQRLLRPYFATASLDRYFLPDEPTHWMLYLTRETAPDIDDLPNVRRHLRRFHRTLKHRREVQRGTIGWWHLHWPRRESLFTLPRILAVQMGREPTFVFAERPTFVGFSVNVVQRPAERVRGYSLPALTAILNSAPAKAWFDDHAKHRGARLDISGGMLRDFPLPAFDEVVDARLSELARRQPASSARKTSPDKRRKLEQTIDHCVSALYDVG